MKIADKGNVVPCGLVGDGIFVTITVDAHSSHLLSYGDSTKRRRESFFFPVRSIPEICALAVVPQIRGSRACATKERM